MQGHRRAANVSSTEAKYACQHFRMVSANMIWCPAPLLLLLLLLLPFPVSGSSVFYLSSELSRSWFWLLSRDGISCRSVRHSACYSRMALPGQADDVHAELVVGEHDLGL